MIATNKTFLTNFRIIKTKLFTKNSQIYNRLQYNCASDSKAIRKQIDKIPMLDQFMNQQFQQKQQNQQEPIYIAPEQKSLKDLNKKFRIETYGCQMNESDSQIVMAIMLESGLTYADSLEEADIILVNTCAIRENAEQKVISRLTQFKQWKKHNQLSQNQLKKLIKQDRQQQPLLKAQQLNSRRIVGVLGCMAERLKEKLLEKSKIVDLIVGPDSYRDLPRLLSSLISGQEDIQINTQLSVEETYSEIAPVRIDGNQISSYISIMRGCNNMCSYCIVPFVRGRERSRDLQSILDEVALLQQQGIKEITFLGQNVNSYHYIDQESEQQKEKEKDSDHQNSIGFGELYKARRGDGIRFEHLLEQAAILAPSIRFRFTSPHPKDFPNRVLQIIHQYPNICNHIHMPAQSGNSDVLQSMRRQYTRESYLQLVTDIRKMFGNQIALSSDFIVGFCGESDEQFNDTMSLMKIVKYDLAFMFAYSSRDKTHAHRKLNDNVNEKDKQERLERLIANYDQIVKLKQQEEIGRLHLVLIDSISKKGDLQGRSDTFKRIVMQNEQCQAIDIESELIRYREGNINRQGLLDKIGNGERGSDIQVGDFVVSFIRDSNSRTLFGLPLYKSSIAEFATLTMNSPFLSQQQQ